MTVIRTALFPTPTDLGNFATVDTVKNGGVLLLLSLGFVPEDFAEFARSQPKEATILLADCYGILGTEAATGRNREFMEQGRGQEYGGVGGNGGRGVTAAAIAGAVTDEAGPAPTNLIIAAHGKPRPQGSPCFGGVAKATWRWDREADRFVPTAGLRIGLPPDIKVGLRVFSGEPDPALAELREAMPPDHRLAAVALFPCYMRGINYYGRDDVEPEAVARLLPGVPVFGMFCHGELGPPQQISGYDLGKASACSQHSMVTVAAFLAVP
ncbi:MAG TPA: hypothetical protein ENI90_07660 [Methylothermaceae bacterium]|nr:hypothetical protein [Methylothermaceae bacterium]